MAKGPEITNDIKMLTARLHHEHPKWTNAEIRNWIVVAVHKSEPSLAKNWPSKFAIDRIMPGIRDKERRSKVEPNPIDQPWTIQSMGISKYRVPAEALPSVMQVWYLAKQERRHFSIRDAQWVGRLYAAIKDISILWHYSFLASTAELWAERAEIQEFVGHELANAYVFSTMIGRSISKREAEKMLGISMEIRPDVVYMEPWSPPVTDIERDFWDSVRIGNDVSKKAEHKRKGGEK